GSIPHASASCHSYRWTRACRRGRQRDSGGPNPPPAGAKTPVISCFFPNFPFQFYFTLLYKVHYNTEVPMTSKDSVREDIAFIRHAIQQGRGYAGAHSFDLLVWGIALTTGYLGTYATVTGWWLINPNWLWAVCIVLPWLYSLR